ncbi:hypothetical protein JMA_00490 [Jeotgalibacillus malaysiensis]|uniref:Uncharacterized protein n=1 Tax=Jeotgalibacillus malaysiensis TaxID=1508404 RepID=A0A0B5AH30_9BACL|nr:hypothetical protein JMA_00490 [Jeotgalibacillus malaysiensis]
MRPGMAKPAGSPPGRGKRPPVAEIISQLYRAERKEDHKCN